MKNRLLVSTEEHKFAKIEFHHPNLLFWFQISVYNIFGMHVYHSAGYFLNNVRRFILREGSLLYNVIKELTTLNKLCHNDIFFNLSVLLLICFRLFIGSSA